jgi:NAD(P)-dependent dehydrogenase (short-subunit alcohol dehydrogenase family)
MAEPLAAARAVAVLAWSADEHNDTVAHIEAHQGKAIALPPDVTDRAAVEQAVASVEDKLGPIDLLVNNAGVVEPIGDTLAAESKAHGISVWALDPGIVRMRMSEWLIDDATSRLWVPWMRSVFDERRDVAIEGIGQAGAVLASGGADALSGESFALATILRQWRVTRRPSDAKTGT